MTRCLRLALIALPLAAPIPPTPPVPLAATAPDFQNDVLPILEAKCVRCHGGKSRGGKLDMRTTDALLKGGASGPAYVPGDSKKSLMIELIHFNEMPPKKEQPRVSKDELELLKRWIDGEKPPRRQ